jgi:hypothetical protein
MYYSIHAHGACIPEKSLFSFKQVAYKLQYRFKTMQYSCQESGTLQHKHAFPSKICVKKNSLSLLLVCLVNGPLSAFFFRDSYTSFNQGFTHSEGNIQWHTPRILKGPQSLKRSAAHVKGFNLNHRFIALKGSYCTRFKQVVHLLETTVHTLKQTTCSSGTAKLFWNKYCTDKILKLETIVYR